MSEEFDLAADITDAVVALIGRPPEATVLRDVSRDLYAGWRNDVSMLEAETPTAAAELRLPGGVVLRMHRAWKPIVFGAALAIALIVSGGITLPGGVALADRVREFVSSFVRLSPADRPVFAALCELSTRVHGGVTVDQIASHLQSALEPEAIERRLLHLQEQEVARETDGRWLVRD